MRGFGKLVREKLREAGCRFVRHGRGDHDIWLSQVNGKTFTVPVHVDSRHTANKIIKDASLPKKLFDVEAPALPLRGLETSTDLSGFIKKVTNKVVRKKESRRLAGRG